MPDMNARAFYHAEPRAREDKPDFTALPAALVADIEMHIGGKIIQGDIAWGGYSPAFSALITRRDGKKFFIKGSHPEHKAHGAKMLAQEMDAYRYSKGIRRVAPEFIGHVTHGSEDDWHLGIWQAIPGAHLVRQWDELSLKAVAYALKNLYGTPPEPGIPPMAETNFICDITSGALGWEKFVNNPDRYAHFAAMFTDEPAARKWLDDHLPDLVEAASQPAANHDDVILNFDLRSDNIVFDDMGAAFLVDWPNACRGPAGYDIISLSANIMADCGYPAWDAQAYICKTVNINIPKADRIRILCQLSGYFALQAYRRVPDKLPRLRWMQKSMLYSLTNWLRREGFAQFLPYFC